MFGLKWEVRRLEKECQRLEKKIEWLTTGKAEVQAVVDELIKLDSTIKLNYIESADKVSLIYYYGSGNQWTLNYDVKEIREKIVSTKLRRYEECKAQGKCEEVKSV